MSKGGFHKSMAKVTDPLNVTGKIAKPIVGDDGGKSRDPLRITTRGQDEQKQATLDQENKIRQRVIANMNKKESLLYGEDKKLGA